MAKKGSKTYVCPNCGAENKYRGNCAYCGTPINVSDVKSNLHGPFPLYWQSFMRINRRYTEAKQIFESYTLRQMFKPYGLMDLGESVSTRIRSCLLQQLNNDVCMNRILF